MDLKLVSLMKKTILLLMIGVLFTHTSNATAVEPTGYLGHYYNIPISHPDMADPYACWGCPGLVEQNLPIALTTYGETKVKQFDWFDEQYFSFSRVDAALTFGGNWWPLNEGVPGDPRYYAVHWEATITVAADGDYNYSMGSDDDSWLFIDGFLTRDMGGIHGFFPSNGSVYLAAGEHSLDIYFAERMANNGGFTFQFTSPVIVRPPAKKIEVDAGPNRVIFSEDQPITVIPGIATDPENKPLTYRWLEGGIELTTWQAVGENGEAPLDLGSLQYLSIGQHTLTLVATDGERTSPPDDMILTIDNSSPHAAPIGAGVYEVNAAVTLGGEVSDFDGDLLDYVWKEGESILSFGSILTEAEGTPVALPDYVTSGLGLGDHTITLQVDDGINDPVSRDLIVMIVDTSVPTLAPVANHTILWPPNHNVVDIFINANAQDNSGIPVVLSAVITSNEPEDGLGDGDTAPDWSVPVIDQMAGTIALQLRAERSGSGNGRVYTITITATDSSGNSSSANVEIIVPHDKANN